MADTLEVRIAHMEGAYEQIDKRLGSLEARLASMEAEMKTMRRDLENRMDNHFRWTLGFQIATLLSLIGTLLAVLLRQ
ncbi:MAG: hypothetical protein ACRD88_01985 [Terriglobia bacterium]